jgi:hypothetical protein
MKPSPDSFKKMVAKRVKVPELSHASLREITCSERPLFSHKQIFYASKKQSEKTPCIAQGKTTNGQRGKATLVVYQ